MAERIHVPGGRQNGAIPAVSVPGVDSRRTATGFGTSAIVHAGLLLLLSLLMVNQQTDSDRRISLVSLIDSAGGEEALALLPDSLETLFEVAASRGNPLAQALPAPVLPELPELRVIDPATLLSEPNTAAVANPVDAAAETIRERVQRAGGVAGEVQFSLSWHSFNDLDLHVITPSGERISWHHRDSRCHGRLDVDMNAEPTTDDAVENVRWLERAAPTGRYTILVHQFRWSFPHRSDPFQLLVNLRDQVQLIERQVDAGSPIAVMRFQYIRPVLKESRRLEIQHELEATQQREEKQATGMLERAMALEESGDRHDLLRRIIRQFPHTDASIQALQSLPPEAVRKADVRSPTAAAGR